MVNRMQNWQLDLNCISISAIELLHSFKTPTLLFQHPTHLKTAICVADINASICSDAGICKGF